MAQLGLFDRNVPVGDSDLGELNAGSRVCRVLPLEQGKGVSQEGHRGGMPIGLGQDPRPTESRPDAEPAGVVLGELPAEGILRSHPQRPGADGRLRKRDNSSHSEPGTERPGCRCVANSANPAPLSASGALAVCLQV